MEKKEQVKYLSRHNKVWEHIKTKKVMSNTLVLKDKEVLTDYRQIPKPKEEEKEVTPTFKFERSSEQ